MSNTSKLILESCDISQSCLEVNARAAIQQCGGQLVLAQRFDVLNDDGGDTVGQRTVTGLYEDIREIPYQQVILHVEKSRQATLDAAQHLWTHMEIGALLYVLGPNALGIKTTLKKIAALLGQTGACVLNKRRARIQMFKKTHTTDVQELSTKLPLYYQVLAENSHEHELPIYVSTRAGVFSVDALDQGSALLQSCLRTLPPARRILDMACGVGHLGIWALRHWQEKGDIHVHFCDADARSIDCVKKNIQKFSLQDHASYQWWAAGEDLLVDSCDMVLLNPPAHNGKDQDLSIARIMFQQAWACLDDGGRMCVVANRQLPYEDDLRKLDADMKLFIEDSIFKVYVLHKNIPNKKTPEQEL